MERRREFLAGLTTAVAGVFAGCPGEGKPETTVPTETVSERTTTPPSAATDISPGPDRTTSWPTYGADLRNRGHVPDGYAPTASVAERWRFGEVGLVESSAAVADGIVYVGASDDTLYALDAAEGTEQWSYETNSVVRSSPTVVGGTVYVGGVDGNVYAIDAADGTERWRFETDDFIISSPAVADPSGGAGAATTTDPTGTATGPSADYSVLVGGNDGNVYALNAADGSERWRFRTDSWVNSSPAVVRGLVYVGSNDGHVYAIEAESGRERWRFDTDSMVESSPAVATVSTADNESATGGPATETVYVGDEDGVLHALEGDDGTEEWRFETGGAISASPAVADVNGTTVYVGSADGTLYAVSAEFGVIQWRFETDGGIRSSPAVVDRTVYVGSDDSNVYAVAAPSGVQRWAFETGIQVVASPAVANGTVYVGSRDGNVYALAEQAE